MSLTYCYEQSKRESVGSYVKAKGSQKQPNGSKNKQGEKRVPTRIKTTGNERYKDFGTQHKRNESPAYNRKYGHKWHHFEACVWPNTYKKATIAQFLKLSFRI